MGIRFFVTQSPGFPEDFPLQVKVQQVNGSYPTGVVWTWDGGNSRIQQHMNTGAISFGMMFVSVPKSYLDGKKVKLDWQGAYEWHWPAQFTIMDGSYDGSSTDDFPQVAGEWFAEKGAGELYNYSTGDQFSFSREVRDTGVLDLSSSQLDDVTIFVRLGDYHNTYEGDLWVYDLQITDASDTVLNSVIKNGTFNITDDGHWDYGTYT
jgi:hypothetical protein